MLIWTNDFLFVIDVSLKFEKLNRKKQNKKMYEKKNEMFREIWYENEKRIFVSCLRFIKIWKI